MIAQRQPSAAELEAYTCLTTAEIARLVLCLLIEEALERRLAVFRSQAHDLLAEPVQGGEEFLL